jgi:hypothetical protein
MSARQFVMFRNGKNPDALFWDAVHQAGAETGNGSYTGTIGDKPGFVLRRTEKFTLAEARAFAEDDAKENNKWGKAFALTVRFNDSDDVRGFLFYGIACD